MRCRKSPVFPGAVIFKNLHKTHVKICKNAMPKSRQNLSSLLSIVGYIFLNHFWWYIWERNTTLGKRSNIPPKIACFGNNSVYRMSDHSILCMANVAMPLISATLQFL